MKLSSSFRYHPPAFLFIAFFCFTLLPSGTNTAAAAQQSTTGSLQVTEPLMRFGTDFIYHSTLSPDGRIIATAGTMGIVLWNAETGERLRILGKPGTLYRSISLSDNAKSIWAGNDMGLTRWNGNSASKDRFLSTGETNTDFVASSPSGTRLLIADSNGFILRNPQQNLQVDLIRTTRTLLNPNGAFSDSGQFLVTISNEHYLGSQFVDTHINLWRAADGEYIREFGGDFSYNQHTDVINAAVFSPDGSMVITGSGGLTGIDNSARLWATTSGTLIQRFFYDPQYPDGFGPVLSVAISPDKQTVLTGHENNAAVLWKVETAQIIHIFNNLSGPITSVDFSRDGSKIIIGTDSGIKYRDSESYDPIEVLQRNPDILNVSPGAYNASAISPDGSWVLTGGDSQSATLWNAVTGEKKRVFNGHTDSISSVAFMPDGQGLATGSTDGSVLVWLTDQSDPTTPTLLQHFSPVNSVSFSPRDRHLLTATENGMLTIWDIDSGRIINSFQSHDGSALSATYSPDGDWIVSADEFGMTNLRKLNDDLSTQTLTDHIGAITKIIFTPDGNRFLTAGEDGTVKLWKKGANAPTLTFEAHNAPINAIDLSPDGRYLLTASDDETIKLWNVATASLVRTFLGHSAQVRSASFSADGTQILTAGADGLAYLWPTGLLPRPPFNPGLALDQGARKALVLSQRQHLKLILVAGGGPYPGNPISEQTQSLANYTHDAATASGFSEENILYLTDFDTTATHSNVHGSPTPDALQDAILNWADDAIQLTIVLIGHGEYEATPTQEWYFPLDSLAEPPLDISATELDALMDTAQSGDDPLPEIHLFVDACYSGGFVTKCSTPPSALLNRSVIAGTTPERLANFGTSSGILSFTYFFMSQARDNAHSLNDSFTSARETIMALNIPSGAPQLPWLDDNGDGVPSPADGELTDRVVFGNLPAFNLSLPEVVDALENKALEQEQDQDLWCDIQSEVVPERVEVYIGRIDPNHPEGDPITETPAVNLAREAETDRWSGTLSATNIPLLGTYSLLYVPIRDDGLGTKLVGVPLARTIDIYAPARVQNTHWILYD